MIDRFSGDRGRAILVEELQRQKLAAGIAGLAEALATAGTLRELSAGEILIEQNGDDTDVFFIVAGSFDIVVNQKVLARRHPGEHIGEMAAISPI